MRSSSRHVEHRLRIGLFRVARMMGVNRMRDSEDRRRIVLAGCSEVMLDAVGLTPTTKSKSSTAAVAGTADTPTVIATQARLLPSCNSYENWRRREPDGPLFAAACSATTPTAPPLRWKRSHKSRAGSVLNAGDCALRPNPRMSLCPHFLGLGKRAANGGGADLQRLGDRLPGRGRGLSWSMTAGVSSSFC